MIFSEKGMRLDSGHVRSILELPNPASKKELLKVLGMFNCVSKFIPNYLQRTTPLRNLVKNGTEWQWSKVYKPLS